ncbi:MAG: hypothetical protein KBD82_01355 [Rhodoferax sp.]|jgi:hypothetical protein|uniref:hypothetical protein n=1 Tax=Rhodoferax sp. TaxID=50421 RepID=UPI001B70A20B|nr:hypothetical protein [Rhodoferax sp.]MBP9734284.1 hypothetical protein [Rhodoferax sp.]
MEIKLSFEAFRRSSRFERARALAENAALSPKQLFILIVQALNQGLGGMEHGVKYKTEHLFEPAVWDGMSDSFRRGVGVCLSYLVDGALVPLVYANKPSANNKLYSPKPGIDPTVCSFKVCQ